MARDGAEIVEQARKYLANLNKETGANVQKDLGQYWANYGQGPDMTPKNTAIQYEPQKKNARTDMQKKKEDRLEVKSTVNAAQIKRDRTKKQYDDYINSEEYRQKQAESVRAQQQAMDQDETQVFSSTSDMQMPTPQQDQKEYMLRLAKEAAEQEYNEAEDKKRFEADMEVINGLSEEDRKRLEIYSASKYNDRELPEEYLVDSLLEDFGRERLDELERTFSRYKNAKRAEEVDAKAREFVSKRGGRGTLANILSIPVQAYSGIIGTGGQLAEMMIGTGGYKTQDPNAYGTIGQTLTGAIRGQTSENITEDLGDGFLGKAASTGYQAVMSAADSVARAYMGGGAFGGATLAATGSFSQTMADASRQGATPAQAALLATVTAGIEAATEKIPLDDLIKVAKGKGASTVLKNLLRQAGIEASTEELSLFGTMLAEAAVLQEKSQYNQTLYTELLAGKPEAEARQAAAMEIWNEVVNTALVSGLSGGFSSLGGSYADYRGWFADTQEQINPELNRPKNSQQAVQDAIANNQARRERLAAEEVTQQPQTIPVQQEAAQPAMQVKAPQQNEQQNLTDIFTEMFNQMRENNGKASNRMAESVMSDPAAMLELGIAPEGTKAEQRRSVKEEMEKLFQKQNPQTETEQNIPEADTNQATKASEQATMQASAPTADMQMGANNQSVEGGQIKGTGAAEANFSGKAAYQDLLYEGNVQRDRPGDVRPVEVPKTDTQGRKVSETVGNFYGAAVTSDEMTNRIEELVQDGALSYDTRTNKQSLENASAEITKRGEESVRAAIAKNVGQNKIQDGDVEKALLLYAKDANDPNRQEAAAEMMVQLQEMATMSGRNLQLFRLVRRMTPEGQLMAIQKEVRANTEKMIKSGSVKKGFEPVANTELEQEYMKAAKDAKSAKSDQARQEAEQSMQELQNAMYLDAAAQMPATFKAKWDAWRYMAMLGNVKTQFRNAVGNAAFVPYKLAKDKISAVAEKVFVPKSQRTKSIGTDFGLVKWAQGDAKTQSVNDALKYSAKLGDDVSSQKFQENMQVFDIKGLEWVRKKIEGLPQKGDILFKNGYYAHSLAGFLRSRGYTAADIQNNLVSKEILDEGRAYAINEAMKATFNDCNAFSDGVAKIGKRGHDPVSKALNYVGESILPFRRTPANILVRFKEYSPIEILRGVGTAAKHIRNGDISAATAIDQMASGLTGTALATFGYFLAAGIGNFKLTGSVTDEDEKRQGHQAYALEFSINGDEYSYKIDWAAPANLPLFVGANIYQAIHDSGGDTSVSAFTSFLDGAKMAVEPMLALSCMSSLNDLVESVRYGEEGEAAFTIAAKIATNYFTQGIPSLARQATQAFTENKQTTFTTSDDPTIRDLQSTVAGLGVGNAYKTDKVNAWGEKESTGTELERIVNSFFNPGTLKKIDNSAVEQEISRLNATGQNVTPDKFAKTVSYIDKNGNGHDEVRLTEEQYQTLAQTQGQTAKKLLDDMIQSDSYQGMTDEQKADAINTAYLYARKTGEIAAIDDHTGYDQGWMYDVEKLGAEEIIRRTINSGINTSTEDLKNAWDNGYNEEQFVREMENMFRSYQNAPSQMKKQVYAEATGTAKKYIEVRDKGISHANAIKAIKAVETVKGTGTVNKETGKKTVRDIDRRQAIAAAGLDEKTTDILMKAYMADYDPSDESPETTEFKYQYAREELGLSAKEYAATYRAYLDNSKKAQKIEAIRAMGYDYKTANALYKLYYGRMKDDLIEMYG